MRAVRAFRGYSQGEVSDLTGLSRQYLSELEQGKRPRPRKETLANLAAALGVTVTQLLGEAPLQTGAPPPAPAGVVAPFVPTATTIRLPDGSLLLYLPAPGAPARPAGCPLFTAPDS